MIVIFYSDGRIDSQFKNIIYAYSANDKEAKQ